MARVKYYNHNNGSWEYADEKLSISPVQSVNSKTGAVELTASDVGAEQSGAIASHNRSESAHPHIMGIISSLDDKFILKSDISTKKAQLTLEDGTIVLIDVVVASEGTSIVKFTNLIPTSIDTDKTIYGADYNGDGVKDGYQYGLRLSSSGVAKEQPTGYPYVTGFMPAKAGDVVRISGIQWYVEGSGINYICAYDKDFNFIGGTTPSTPYGEFQTSKPTMDCTTELTTCTLPANLTNIAYIRVNWVGDIGVTYTPTLAIVTVNEEIE